MAKEVKLFNLSDFLVGRYARLSDEFYDANKRLAIKRNVVSTAFVTIGTLGYYGAYAVTIYLTVLGRFSIGTLTFLAGSFRASRDLREYDLSSLRKNIGVIFQDFVRYDFVLRENIGVSQVEALEDDARVREAARRSLADSVASRLAKGYDQMLGRRFDGGVELSGGEWQKVALGRAYMRDAQVLLLDEPTASLDARAEYEVFLRFAELTKGRMAVLISHRFSTVRM